jgi:uroporphyrinogen decarboxylase
LIEVKAGTMRFLEPFAGKTPVPPPIWLMRQAGRYLPEYRATRAQAGGFLDLCYNPVLAAEVTLQPIRRYGFDAAILFSDILVVPHALGQRVGFVEGEGPQLDAITDLAGLARLDPSRARGHLAPVLETVQRLRQDLPKETALIGFCGAPWTVATYMVEGGGSKEQARARLWAYRDGQGFGRLVELLVEASVDYLCGQVEAGVDALQIFDTWAGSLPDGEFDRWVVAPTRAIIDRVRARHRSVPIIGFPRGAGPRLGRYVAGTGVDGVGCDTAMPLAFALRAVAVGAAAAAQAGSFGAGGVTTPVNRPTVLQGNLDPLLLVAGGAVMEARVREILAEAAGHPFVFNLGHGIVPETPPEHVARLVEVVRCG